MDEFNGYCTCTGAAGAWGTTAACFLRAGGAGFLTCEHNQHQSMWCSLSLSLSRSCSLSLSLSGYSPLPQSSQNCQQPFLPTKQAKIFASWIEKSEYIHQNYFQNWWKIKSKMECDSQLCKSYFQVLTWQKRATHRPTENRGKEQNENDSHLHCVTVWCLERQKNQNIRRFKSHN